MALNDLLKDLTTRAQDAASAHKDQIQDAVAKAEAAAQERTGGQYHQQIANAGAKVNDYLARLPDPPAASQSGAGEPTRDPTEPPAAASGSTGSASPSV